MFQKSLYFETKVGSKVLETHKSPFRIALDFADFDFFYPKVGLTS
jgi:hypothetical protein